MSEEKKIQKDELSAEELEAQTVEALPDREEMTLIDVNVAAPVNPSVTHNILPEDPAVTDTATEDVDITQPDT